MKIVVKLELMHSLTLVLTYLLSEGELYDNLGIEGTPALYTINNLNASESTNILFKNTLSLFSIDN